MLVNGIKFNGRGFQRFVSVSDLPETELPHDDNVDKIWIEYQKGWGWILTDYYTNDTHKVFDTLAEARNHVVKTYCPNWQVPQHKQDLTPKTVRSFIHAMIERDKRK